MAEPKKETVRIVLPARRDGQPVASNPRETAMINLPPKPVLAPAPAGSPIIPPPAAIPSPIKPPSAGVPSIPRPPSALGIPKPPGAPLVAPSAPPTIPRPPSAITPPAPVAPRPPSPVTPAAAPVAPRPPSATVPPAAAQPPVAPTPVAASLPKPVAPSPAPAPVAPAPIVSETKKETAKVQQPASGSKVIPQATVQLQRKPEASTPKSVATTAPLTVVSNTTTEAAGSGDVSLVFGVAALVVSLAALGVQIWTMLPQ
ncbi:MAG: hypothetical protein ACOYNN_09310 [Terrimicrobiaceae bacterium]